MNIDKFQLAEQITRFSRQKPKIVTDDQYIGIIVKCCYQVGCGLLLAEFGCLMTCILL